MSTPLQKLLGEQDNPEETTDPWESIEISREEAEEIAGGARTFSPQVACDESC